MSLLGIPDGKVKDSNNLSWNTNKIGGKPNWMYEGCELGTCERCGRKLKLVLQIYCPLGGSPYHRTLYISTCGNKACWNNTQSWKVQRCQILDQSSKTSQSPDTRSSSKDCWNVDEDDWADATQSETVSMDATEWCGDADDWGDAVDDNSIAIPKTGSSVENIECDELKLEQLNLVDIDDELSDSMFTNRNHGNSNHGDSLVLPETEELLSKDSVKHVMELLATETEAKMEPFKEGKNESRISCSDGGEKVMTCVRPFDCFYLSVVDEHDVVDDDDGGHVHDLLKKYLHDSGTDLKSLQKSKSSSEGDGVGEEYEKTDIKGDKYSHKFYKRLKFCPQQCIRYCWDGQPMFISKPSLPREITCSYCKGPCVFELQLMPPLINFLKNPDGERVEFGTVLIYTCKSSCLSSMCVLESLYVQPDPDHHLFK